MPHRSSSKFLLVLVLAIGSTWAAVNPDFRASFHSLEFEDELASELTTQDSSTMIEESTEETTAGLLTTEGATGGFLTTEEGTSPGVVTTEKGTTAGIVTTEGASTGMFSTEGPTGPSVGTTEGPTGAGTTEGPTGAGTTEGPTDAGTTEGPTDAGTTEGPTGTVNTEGPTDAVTTEGPTDAATTDEPATDSMTTEEGTTDLGTTEEPTTESPYQRTVVFIKKQVYDDQYVFVRGGIEEEDHPECGAPAETDPCSLPMSLESLGDTPNYDKYNAWRVGDDFFDWFGAEMDQGSYTGIPASGSPMAWTTNTPGVDGYQELNNYGEHYWMMEFYMDCTLTEDGWFEIKGWLEFAEGFTGWELDINQQTCTGGVGGIAPYASKNHKGRCGHINVFTWNEGDCVIDPFPNVGTTVNPGSTEDPGSSVGPSIQRTTIFIEQHTVTGQDVFLLGGLQDPLSSISTCTGGTAETDSCSLPITIRPLGTTSHYDGFNDWRVGDDYLDWLGAEAGQGSHNGVPPDGTPSAWTSNVPGSPGYQELNTFGEAYWMLDFDLDCSLTEDGWFTVKGWLAGDAGQFSGLEADITQESCTGTAGGPPPYISNSHIGRCGHINVFHYGRGDCTINTF